MDEEILLDSIDTEFATYQNAVTGTEITDDFDVLHWFHKKQMKLTILTCFAYIIHSITPLKYGNEIDLSLTGIYTASYHDNTLVEIRSDLISTNRNSTDSGRNTPIDVFGISLEDVANIVDKVDRNSDAFVDTSDTDYFLLSIPNYPLLPHPLITLKTCYISLCTVYSNYLIYNEKDSYFVGIKTILE